ncbi:MULTISPECIES: hypothetical protein [Xanthomonas]|uniref:hypothetical protein n=1 Tax=Xanthomonas TaxID=338 RepID=UPI0011B0B2B1|nr:MULTISPECIES: hypothetical protein [Xanthomonas]MEA0681713.1 hypothetical protein [Xanthomonas campestris pv. campestris]MEA0814380.1 hypothetical protein [Xanthomonas campestris pv. campestris]MEA9709326.1 hypothetical protein [Xanthomonas campestris]MEA9782906.1 hypothetical protein [Xanthomonas campestris pv. raphani]MEA9791034.1 hypothetical protein [Xanthomonas campestris pv. raphani]
MSAFVFLSEFLGAMTSWGAISGRCSRKEVTDIKVELNKLKKRIAKLEQVPDSKGVEKKNGWTPVFFSYLFVLSGILAVATAVFFVKGGVAEYLSYISPLLAAIIGGAGVYFSEKRAGMEGQGKVGKVLSAEIVCYLSSIGVGSLGLIAFFAYKEVVIDLAVAMMVPFAFMLSFFLFLIRVREDNGKSLGGRNWLLPSFMLVVVCAGLAYCWLEFVIGGQKQVNDAAAAAVATKNEARPK